MTHPRGREASAPGKTYLFMLTISSLPNSKIDNLQKSPVEILILPTSPNTRNLEDHDTIISEQVVDILEESRVSPNTDMFGHFKTRDLVVVSSPVGYISEIMTEDPALRFGDVVLLQSLGTEFSLFPSECDCSSAFITLKLR